MSTFATGSADAKARPKRRRPTTEELLKALQILGTVPAPLPPNLPPSPPVSRDSSPAPGHASSSKRKLDADAHSLTDNDSAAKRLRPHAHKHHASASDVPTPASTASYSSSASSLSKATTGESSSSSSKAGSLAPNGQERNPSAILPTPYMPVRRPRHGKGTREDFDRLHDYYHILGRQFKYSGDARFWSTFPPSHKHFKPLLHPAAHGTPYHTHGGLMSRLELVDALLCFVYSLWCQDYQRGRCAEMSWSSIHSFLSWCKQKWTQENSIGVREKMFIGLIHMIEAFIHQRKVQYAVMGHIERDLNELVKPLPRPEDLAKAARAGSAPMLAGSSQRTPPGMLPSPAGTLGASSANSTPTNPNNGTPKNSGSGNDAATGIDGINGHLATGASGPSAHLPAPVLPPALAIQLEAPVPQALLWQLKDAIEGQNAAAHCMRFAQLHVSLPALREHFPRTFGRMVFSTLTAQDEHEPDMEDDEGELFWPGQCVTGEGLGWVCLMGRAMVKEFGKEFGYKGIEGIIPKPDDDRRPAARP